MTELIIIAVCLLAMVVIGVMTRRRVWQMDEFLVLGRKGSMVNITGSLISTIIGGSATIGMAGLGFTRGLTGAWWLLVGSIGLITLGLWLAKKVRSFGVFTLPGLIEKQYGSKVALAAAILIVVAWTAVIAGQIIAAGKILSVLGIGSTTLWMVIFTFVFVSYTVIGGQYAVVRTDLWQAIIIFVGIFGGLAMLLPALGGFSGLKASLTPDKFAFPFSSQFTGMNLFSYLLLIGMTYVVGPDMYSRIFCARDGNVARYSTFWAALLLIPLALAITIIGMGASALFPNISPEMAFPTIVKEVLPPFFGGLVLAALVAAVMSSASLMGAGTILAVDIVKRFRPSIGNNTVVRLSRWSVLLVGVFALLLALSLKGVINSLLFAYTVYTGGVIMPVLFSFYKNRLKVTSNGALAAIIGGGATAVISKVFAVKYLDIGALGVSAALLLLVSFIENLLKSRSK